MSNQAWKALSERLTKVLGLKYKPIAITFSQNAPAGVAQIGGERPAPSDDGRTGKVAAGCVFWIKSETQTFTTAPEDHYNCSVGSVTHGLKPLEAVMNNQDVHELLESEWVTPAEAMSLPVIRQRPNFITYGPLQETPIDPDVVLLRINAFQAMVIHDGYPGMPIVGKPQCHIIPMAKEEAHIAMSTGCMLSRVRTGMTPDEMTCTIPARRLAEVIDQLEARKQANSAVSGYANKDLQRFA